MRTQYAKNIEKTTDNNIMHQPAKTYGAYLSDNRPQSIQRKQNNANHEAIVKEKIIQKAKNNTGLPDKLKSGIENLSGYSMSDVKVHYNSSKPAQLNAHAYAQGTNIHVAPGQQKHLPHEAWHVVQQKQGRVKPTLQMKSGVPVNDDTGLEKEADVMGSVAMQKHSILQPKMAAKAILSPNMQYKEVVQRIENEEIEEKLSLIDMTRNFSIPDFLNWQKSIGQPLPTHRTMGPEFEFAKIDREVPAHVLLGTSTTTINGLPLVIETDAGWVIEIACPPFVISTSMGDFEKANSRSIIITDVFERNLKRIAAVGVAAKQDLGWLMQQLANFFGLNINITDDYEEYKTAKLLKFTKGQKAYVNTSTGVTADHMTNSQINIKMTTEEVGAALIAHIGSDAANDLTKDIYNSLKGLFVKFKGELGEEKYNNYLAIITHYFAHTPLMALQSIMNNVRNIKKARHKQTKDENRKQFAVDNQALLTALSQVKDKAGFWIKASLNDMMRGEPQIKFLVSRLNPAKIARFILARSTTIWEEYRPGLERYFGTSLEGIFEIYMSKIIDNMMAMATSEAAIKKVTKIEFPLFTADGKIPGKLLDYESGTPFMVRPDTNVSLDQGHLVEVRGLNKGVTKNEFMKGFQMPYYRKYRKLSGRGRQMPDLYP